MRQNIIAVFYSKPDWFHHTLTKCSSVAGVDIDVSAPEAFRTVIGITVSYDLSATMCAGKIFNVALESFLHSLAPAFFS